MIVPQDCDMLAVKLFHDWLLAVVVSDFFLSNYNELKNFILHFDLHKKTEHSYRDFCVFYNNKNNMSKNLGILIQVYG